MLVWQAHKARIRHMAFSPDGTELATTAGTSKFVHRWRAATGEPAGKLAGHTSHARAVAYSPDGRFLASTQNEWGARVWDRAAGTVVGLLNGASWHNDSIAFHPNSLAVAVATGQGVCEWLCAEFAGANQWSPPSNRFGTHRPFHRVLYAPCGRYLAASSFQWIAVYGAVARDELRSVNDPQGSAEAAQFAFAPDGNTVAVVFGLRIHLFAVPAGSERAVLRGHPNYIHALGFMPDGRAVVSAGADGVVRVWNPVSGAETRSFDWGIGKVCAAAVSPDGMLCAAGGENGKIVVWDVDA